MLNSIAAYLPCELVTTDTTLNKVQGDTTKQYFCAIPESVSVSWMYYVLIIW